MKKLLSALLALIIFAIPTTAFAESYSGSGQTEIISHEYSTYTISIPEEIILEESGNIPVTLMNANIESGYKVVVRATNAAGGVLPLFHIDGSHVEKDINLFNSETGERIDNTDNIIASFEEETFNIEDTYQKTVQFSYSDNNQNLKAGIYSGTLEYSFQCEPIV